MGLALSVVEDFGLVVERYPHLRSLSAVAGKAFGPAAMAQLGGLRDLEDLDLDLSDAPDIAVAAAAPPVARLALDCAFALDLEVLRLAGGRGRLVPAYLDSHVWHKTTHLHHQRQR